MIRSTIYLSAFFAIASNCVGQFALEDAIFLNTDAKTENIDGGKTRLSIPGDSIYLAVLAQYTELEGVYKREEIAAHFNLKDGKDPNPFIEINLSSQDGTEKVDVKEISASSLIGGFDITNLAVGLTDFIIERTKHELNTAFFKRFREELKDPRYKTLRILFPETVEILDVIGEQIYQYDLYLNSLKIAFEKDLRNILRNLPTVLQDPSLMEKEPFKSSPEILYGLLLACELATGVQNDKHPGELLRDIATSEYSEDLIALTQKSYLKDIVNAIRTCSLISNSFQSSGNNYWVSTEQLEKLRNEKVLRIYMGLLYEMSKKGIYAEIEFKNMGDSQKKLSTYLKDVGTIWNTSTDAVSSYKSFLIGFGNSVSTSTRAIKNLEEIQDRVQADTALSKRQKRHEMYLATSDVFMATIGLIKRALDVDALPKIDLGGTAQTMKKIEDQRIKVNDAKKLFDEAKKELTDNKDKNKTADLKNDLSSNRSSFETKSSRLNVLNDQFESTTSFYEDLFNYLELGGNIGVQIANKQYAGTISEVVLLLKKTIPENTSNVELQLILKYGNFMAAVVEAENPTQVKEAISAVALPPGSYAIKRHSAFSVSLNAYAGGFVGHEHLFGDTTKLKDQLFINNYAVTVPVGVSMNWGLGARNHKNPWSIGLSIPIIDLGAVASYRITQPGDSIGSIPDLNWENLFAPGLICELGIGGTPLTFGLGAQLSPRLRKIEAGSTTIGDLSIRYGVSLKVDVPIINFYSKPTKPKLSVQEQIDRLNTDLRVLEQNGKKKCKKKRIKCKLKRKEKKLNP